MAAPRRLVLRHHLRALEHCGRKVINASSKLRSGGHRGCCVFLEVERYAAGRIRTPWHEPLDISSVRLPNTPAFLHEQQPQIPDFDFMGLSPPGCSWDILNDIDAATSDKQRASGLRSRCADSRRHGPSPYRLKRQLVIAILETICSHRQPSFHMNVALLPRYQVCSNPRFDVRPSARQPAHM